MAKWQMMSFPNPLNALIPEILFSFFAEFWLLSPLNSGVSLGGFWGTRHLSLFFFGGRALARGMYRPPPPPRDESPPIPALAVLWPHRTRFAQDRFCVEVLCAPGHLTSGALLVSLHVAIASAITGYLQERQHRVAYRLARQLEALSCVVIDLQSDVCQVLREELHGAPADAPLQKVAELFAGARHLMPEAVVLAAEVPADECLTDVARASISPRLSPDSPRRPHPDSRERPSSDSPDHTAVRSVGERTTVVRTSYDESGAEYVASPTGSGYLPSDLGVAETVSLDGSRDAIREINGYPRPPPPKVHYDGAALTALPSTFRAPRSTWQQDQWSSQGPWLECGWVVLPALLLDDATPHKMMTLKCSRCCAADHSGPCTVPFFRHRVRGSRMRGQGSTAAQAQAVEWQWLPSVIVPMPTKWKTFTQKTQEIV